MTKKASLYLGFFLLIVLLGFTASRKIFSASMVSPMANITVTPGTSGTLDTVFEFDASTSRNSYGKKDGLMYRWNLRDDTGYTEWSKRATMKKSFDKAGDRNIWLEIKDSSGAGDQTKIKISVKDSESPSGIVFADPRQGTVETVFLFVVTPISRINTPRYEMRARYDFENDGVWDTDFIEHLSVYHVYHDTGSYTPAVEIKDLDGGTYKIIGVEEDDEKRDWIRVISSESPDASFSVTPAMGTTNFTFEFDASLSFDNQDHHNLKFRWDFENDGIWDTKFTSVKTANTKYSYYGKKDIRLEVKDSEGYTDQTVRSVIVERGANSPPRADFSIKVKYGSKKISGNAGTIAAWFDFDAKGTKDFEDKNKDLYFRWDFEDDGVWDTSFNHNSKAEHQYSDPGEYRVRLQVEDKGRLQDSMVKTVQVVSNEKPFAVFSVTPSEGTSSTQFKYDASDSFDAQTASKKLQVRWDFEGDGAFDTNFSSRKTAKHTFRNHGNYQTVLQVKDIEGAVSESRQTVGVVRSSGPKADLRVDKVEGVFQTEFNFDASKSHDKESPLEDLEFRWDFDKVSDSDLNFDTTFKKRKYKQSKKKFNRVGKRIIRVEVRDPEGNTDIDEVEIEILPEAEDVDFLYKKDIMKGYPDGTFRVRNKVNRGEMTYMALKSAGISTKKVSKKSTPPFPDIKHGDWFFDAIYKAKELGIVTGYPDGNFHPEWDVNRAEAIYMTLEAFGVEMSCSVVPSDVKCIDWYGPAISTALRQGILDHVFYQQDKCSPGKKMTRGEVAHLLKLSMQAYNHEV